MKYILYARKSTEQEERQAMSIESQENELLRMAEKLGFRIDKTYKESMSAKKVGRPIFNEMLNYISKQKDCVLLAWKIDRLTRNISDGARILDLLENGNIKEIRTIDKIITNNSMDNFMLVMDFGIGKKYSDDLSMNVKRGLKAKLEKGGWPGMAPLGYLNEKIGKTICVDEERAMFIKKMFELYATGSFSLRDITNILHEQGFRTRTGKKVHKSKIHKILSNPFFYGMMKKHEKIYEGNHEAIISKKLFDDVQIILFGKIHSKKQHLFFPFRGFMKCHKCGCMLTASIKKGHHYYYCTNGKDICEEHTEYMRGEYLTEKIANVFDQLKFDEEIIESAYLASKEKIKNNKSYSENVRENIGKQLDFTREKQSKLLDSHLSNLITNDVYEAKMKELNNEMTTLETQLKKIRNNSDNGFSTLEQTKKVFLEATRAKKDFVNADDNRKRNILEKLLWNLTIESRELAEVSYRMPYQVLANTPKNCDFLTLLGRRDSNPRCKDQPARGCALGAAREPSHIL